MAKINDRVLKGRLGTSSCKDVFLKSCPYDPRSKLQELEIGSVYTFMPNKIKIFKSDFELFFN